MTSTVLEDEEGESFVVAQENLGPDALEGSGEWPSPDAPPQAPAPGSADEAGSDREASGSGGAFKDAQDRDPVAGGSKSTPD